jgi:hypothetical protein
VARFIVFEIKSESSGRGYSVWLATEVKNREKGEFFWSTFIFYASKIGFQAFLDDSIKSTIFAKYRKVPKAL